MESANLHHHQQHQHQDEHHHHILHPPNAFQATPPCYGVGTNTCAWTPNNINSHNFNPEASGEEGSSRHHQNDYLVPDPMVQELGFHWANSNSNATTAGSFNSNSSSSSIEDFHRQQTTMKIDPETEFYDMSEKLLLRNLSASGTCQINGLSIPAGPFIAGSVVGGSRGRGNFSQIFPTINISNMNKMSSAAAVTSSSEMNMQALDLFNSGTFSGFLSQSSYGLDQIQKTTKTKLSSAMPSIGGATEAKRSNNFLEPKAPQAAQKKSRSDSRTSCPPFKVRKEKLGDRIAALQQLVAPFGKTDTASVLMEAIGYINFLQNQVETLSVPYMKRNRTTRTIRGDLIDEENGEGARERDLRSRGLCLVPLSCLSYVTDGTGGVWPLPNFSPGGT